MSPVLVSNITFILRLWTQTMVSSNCFCCDVCFRGSKWISQTRKGIKPMTDPWDWYIYLHLDVFYIYFMVNVGKYTSPMDPLGNCGAKGTFHSRFSILQTETTATKPENHPISKGKNPSEATKPPWAFFGDFGGGADGWVLILLGEIIRIIPNKMHHTLANLGFFVPKTLSQPLSIWWGFVFPLNL